MGFNHLLVLSFMALLAFTVNAATTYSQPPPHYPPPPPPHHPPPPPPPHPKPFHHFHLPKPEEGVYSIGVQGMIYCKEGSYFAALKGAVARVTCKATDKHGLVTGSYTVLSDTSESGYFLAMLSASELKEVGNITECKAYLDMSSKAECSIPTDVHYGITGSHLTNPRYLHNNKMLVYTVGPFEYIPLLPKPGHI